MKNFFSSIVAICFLAQPYQPVSAQLAITDQKSFKLEQQTTALELNHEENAPIYETHTVPDTCYRSVQHGTRNECHTEYDKECHTTMENECQNIPHDVCVNAPESVCENVGNQVCANVPENVCHTEYDSVCENQTHDVCSTTSTPVCENHSQQVCSDVPERTCRNETSPVCENTTRQVCEDHQVCTPDPVVVPAPSRNTATPSASARRFISANLDHKLNVVLGVTGCHMEQTCHAVTERSCHDDTHQVCNTQNRRECHDENQQVCHNESHTSCHPESASVCHNVPRQSCHVEDHQSCHTEYHQECHVEDRQSCHTEYSQSCGSVPREHCENVPRQACEDVPNIEQEAYACTREERVQTGSRLTKKIAAEVKVVITNFGKVELPKDTLKVSLIGEDVGLSIDKAATTTAGNNGKILFHIVKKDVQVQAISEVEKNLKFTFELELLSTDQLNAMKDVKISELKLFSDKMAFKILPDVMNGLMSFEKGHLKIVRDEKTRILRRTYEVEVLDQDFDPSKTIKKEGDLFELNYTTLKMEELSDRNHHVHIELKPKALVDRATVLNPEALDRMKFPSLVGEIEGYPRE